jgi:hypothetical protein
VHPKEIGYYVAPPQPRSENGNTDSDFAMSMPAFAPERREIWWSDGTSGFYVLRVDKSVWPAGAAGSPRPRAAITNLRISPSVFPAANRRGSVALAARRRGARVTYRDTQPATTTFTVLKAKRGVRRGTSCVRPRTRTSPGRRCTRYVRVGSFRRVDRAGANRFRFTGRLRGRKLAPGRYRLKAVPRFDGRNGRAAARSFRIIRG